MAIRRRAGSLDGRVLRKISEPCKKRTKTNKIYTV